MAQPKKVLFFTNSENGQANVVLATAYELLSRHHAVHIASFTPIEKLITQLNSAHYGPLPPSPSARAVFHPIRTASMIGALRRHCVPELEFVHSTGVRETLRLFPKLPGILCPWDADEYVRGVECCVQILGEVGPDVVVCERLCAQGMDACGSVGRNFVVLSPNTYRETLRNVQPYMFGLWGMSSPVSGFPVPLPWYLIPLNVLLNLYVVIVIMRSPKINDLLAVRKRHNIPGRFPYMTPYNGKRQYILPSTPECDLPIPYIPPNVTSCGTILLPSPPLVSQDPPLEVWLRGKQTVLVNLGSLFTGDKDAVQQLAYGIGAILEQNPFVQVLWKLPGKDAMLEAGVRDVLVKDLEGDRLRVEEWLVVEPGALLMDGGLVLIVHHGGANTYYEAVQAGVPQVILPVWFDTHSFATRVEFLGIGIHGSRGSTPKISGAEFSRAANSILDENNEKGRTIREHAAALGRTMSKYRGRETACERILECAVDPEFGPKEMVSGS